MTNSDDNNWDDIEILTGWSDCNNEYFKAALQRVSYMDVGPWELSILEAIWFDYGQVRDKRTLASISLGRYFDQYPDKSQIAVEKCFANGWIQSLTAEFVDRKQQELIDGGYLMPNGLIGHYRNDESLVGLISFTEPGAALYQNWLEFDPIREWHWCIGDDAEGFCVSYGTTLDACEYPINESVEQVIHRESAIEIGRWCDRWWNRFEKGFRIRYRTKQG